ncbi:uncharacterized protein LOC143446089 isoform X2 [Clavelina lepadiformis]|uniref:uncharacterized protein LOC143446089 isoform X2 n=1 Tax=Clavelina lepadiformis TaxID=159417 RepID=UPI0040412EC2
MELDESEQQLLLINQLKDLIRKKDEEVNEKNKQLKEAESKLNKARLQSKAKDAKLAALAKKGEKDPSDANGVNCNNDTGNRGKLLIQQKRIEEKEEKIAKQTKALKDQEERFARMELDFHTKHAELTQQLKQVSTNRGIDVEAKQKDSRHMEELYAAIVVKDQKIADITAKLDERESQLQDRERVIKEMQTDLKKKTSNETHQRLLLDKLSSRLAEQEEHVAMTTEENNDELTQLQTDLENCKEKMAHLEQKLYEKEETVNVKEEQILQLKREHDAKIIDVQEVAQDNEQLIRSLKRKLHEQDEVLSGKDKVVQLLQDELQDRAHEHDELHKTITILQQNLREIVEGRQLLMEELENMQQKFAQGVGSGSDDKKLQLIQALQQYEQAYKQASDTNNILTHENITLKEKLQTLGEEHSKLTDVSQMTKDQLEAATESWKKTEIELTEKVTFLKNDVEEKQKAKAEHAHAMEVRMQTVLDQLNAQTKVLENQTAELIEHKERLCLMEAGNDDVKNQELQDTISHIAALESSLKTSQMDQSSLHEKLIKSEGENAHLIVSLSHQKSLEERQQLDMEDLKVNLQEAEKQLEKYGETLKGKDLDVENLKKELSDLELEHCDMKTRYNESLQSRNALEDQLQNLNENIDRLNIELTMKTDLCNTEELKLNDSQSELKNLKESLATSESVSLSLKAEVNSLTDQLSFLNESISAMDADTQQKVESVTVTLNQQLMEEKTKYEEASSQIEILTDSNRKYENENALLSQKIIDLSSQMTEINLRSSEFEANCIKLSTALEQQQEQLLSACNEVQNKDIELHSLKADLSEQCKEAERREESLTTASQKLEVKTNQVEEMSTASEVAVEKINKLLEQVSSLQHDKSSLGEHIHILEGKIEGGEVVLSEKIAAESRLEQLNAEIKPLEEQVLTLRDDNDKLKSRMNDIVMDRNDELASMEEKISTLEEVKTSLQEEKNKTEQMLLDANQKIQDLVRSIETSQNDLNQSHNQHTSTIQERDDITQQLNELEILKQSLENNHITEKQNWDITVNDLKSQLKDAIEQNALLQSQYTSLQNHHQLLSEDNTKLTDLVEDGNSKVLTLQEDLKASTSSLTASNNKLIDEVQEAQMLYKNKLSELEAMKTEFETLRTCNEETLNEISEMRSTLNEVGKARTDLETDLKDTQTKLLKYEQDVDNLRIQLSEKEERSLQVLSDLDTSLKKNQGHESEIDKVTISNQHLLAKICDLESQEEEKKNQHDEEVRLLQCALAEKDLVLEEVSMEYSKLQDEITASKTEFERWKVESTLMKERDDAVHRASELEDTMHNFEKIIQNELSRFSNSSYYSTNHITDDDGLHHTIMLYFEHNAQLESRLLESENKLQEMQSEQTSIHQSNSFYGEYSEENLGSLQITPCPPGGAKGGHHQQGMEYLQQQLEELAHEQETQSIEHEKTTSRLNETIRRIREEKQQLLEAFEKQSESLNDVLKRYEEKDFEWNNLTRLVEDQQHSLAVARASQESSSISSAENSREVQELEGKLNDLEEKYSAKMAELSLINSEKEKYEFEIPELKSKLTSLKEENMLLVDQTRQNKSTIESLQQELEQAIENAEVNNNHHQEDIGRLKSLLREKDKEITVLHEDIGEKDHETQNLYQSVSEKNDQLEQLNENLQEQQAKVSHLTSELREREAEVVAISQQHDGAVEHAQVRAKDLAEYVATLEGRVHSREEESKSLKLEIEALQDSLSLAENKMVDLNFKMKENDETYQHKLYEADEKYQLMLNDHEEAKIKYENEVNSEKEKNEILQERLDSQASDVRNLTSMLEGQIQEANHHHQEATASLEKKMQDLEMLLQAERQKVVDQNAELQDSQHQLSDLQNKFAEKEKWETEAREKSQLCEQLSASCSVLEERLQESLKQARAAEEELFTLKSEFLNTCERLEQREELVQQLGAEVTKYNDEIRQLKETLQLESERQINELNSLVESQAAERDEQLQAANNRIIELSNEVKLVRDKYEAEKNENFSKVEDMENELNKMKSMKFDLEEQLYDMQKKEESWMTTSSQLEQKVKELTEKSNQSQLESSMHDDEVVRLTEELNKSKQEAQHALDDQAAKHDAQKEKAKKIVRAQQIQMKHVKEEKEKLDEEVKRLRGEISTKDKVLEENLQKHGNNNDKMSSLVQQIQELEQELIASQRKNEEAEILSTSLKEQVSSLMLSSQDESQFRDEMKSELTSIVEQHKLAEASWQTKLNEATNLNDRLAENEQKMSQQLQERKQEQASLLETHQSLKEELHDAHAKLNHLSSSLEEKQKEDSTSLQKISSLEKDIESLHAERNEFLNKVDELEQLKTSLSLSLQQITDENRLLSSSKEDNLSTLQQLEMDLKQSNLFLEEQQEIVQSKTAELDAALHKITESESNVVNLQVKLNEAYQQYTNDEDKFDEASNQFKSKIVELQQEISDAKDATLEQEKLVLSLQEERNSFAEMLKTEKEEKASLEESQRMKEANSLEEQKVLLDSLRSTIQDLNLALQESREDLDAGKAQIASLVEELKVKDEKLEEYAQKHNIVKESMQQKSDENLAELRKLSDSHQILVSELNSKSNELQQIHQELSSIKEEKETLGYEFRNITSRKDAELFEMKENLISYEVKLDEAAKQKERLESSVKSTSTDAENLKNELDALKSNVASLSSELHEVQCESGRTGDMLQNKTSDLESASQRINLLQNEVSNLNEQLVAMEQLREENISFNKMKEDLLNELSKLKEDSVNGDQEVAKLRMLLEEEEQKKHKVEMLLKEEESQVEELKTQLNNFTNISHDKDEHAKNEFERFKAGLHNELDSIQKNLIQVTNQLDESQQQNIYLQKELEDVRATLNTEKAINEELFAKCAATESDLNEKMSVNAQLQTKVQQLTAELSEKHTFLEEQGDSDTSKNAHTDDLKSQCTILETKCGEYEEKLSSFSDLTIKVSLLENEVADKAKSLNETQRKLKASLVSRKSLMSKVKELELANVEKDTLNKLLVEEKSSLENQLSESMNSSLQVQEESFQKESEFASEEKRKISQLEDEITSLQQELSQRISAAEGTAKQQIALQENLKALQDESERKMQENENLCNKISSMQNQLKESSSTYQSEIGTLRDSLSSVESEKSQLHADFERCSTELEAKSQEAASLSALLSSSENVKTNREEEIEMLKHNIHSKEDEVEALKERFNEEHEKLERYLQDQDTAQEIQEQLNAAHQDLDSLRKDLQFMAGEKERADVMHIEVKSQLESDIVNLKNELQAQSHSFNDLNSDCERKNDILKHLQMEIDEKASYVMELVAERDNALSKCSMAGDTIITLQQSLDDAGKKFSKLQNESQAQRLEMEAVNDSQRDLIKDLEGKIAELNDKVKTAQTLKPPELVRHEEMQMSSDAEVKLVQLQRKLKAALVSRKELLAASKKKEEELALKSNKLLSFQADLDNALAEKTRNASSIEQLQATISNLENQLQERDANALHLQQEKERLKNELHCSKHALDEANASSHDIKEKMVLVEEENVGHIKKIDDMKNEVITLETCNKDLNEMVSAMEARTGKMEKNLTERTESLRSAQKCIRKLETTMAQGETSLEEIVEIKKNLKDYENRVKYLQEKCDALEAEKGEKISMLEKLMVDFEKETMAKDDFAVRCKGLENMVLQAGGDKNLELENLLEKYNNLLLEHAALNKTCKELEKDHCDVGALTQKVSDLSLRNDELTSMNIKFTQEVADLQNQIHALERKPTHQAEDMLAQSALQSRYSDIDGTTQPVEVKLKAESLQTSSPVDELTKAKLEIINETLAQLKVTQPEMWNQEPGIKKLINKLEEVAGKSAELKKKSNEWVFKLGEEEKKASELQDTVQKLQEEIRTLKQSEVKLTEKVEDLREVSEEYDSLKKKYDALQRDCDHLNSALQEEKDSYEQIQKRLDKENSLIKKKIQEQRRSLSSLQTQLRQANSELEQTRKQYQESEENTNDLQKKLESVMSDEETLRSALIKKDESHKTALVELKENLDKIQQKKGEVHDELARVNEEKEQLKVAGDDTKKKLEEVTESMTREIDELKQKVEELNTNSESRLLKHQSALSTLQEELHLKNNDFQDLKTKYDDLFAELNSNNEMMLDLRSQLQQKDQDMQIAQQSLEHQEAEKMNLQSKIEEDTLQGSAQSELEDAMESLYGENEDLQKELKERQSLVSDLVSDCMRLKTELATTNTELENSKTEVSNLFSQTQSLLALKAQYETNENHLKSELAEKDRVIHKQQEEVEEVRNQQVLLLKEYGVSSIAEIQALLNTYVMEIKYLKDEIVSMKEDFEELKNEIHNLEFQNTGLDGRNEQLLEQIAGMDKKISEYDAEISNLIERCSSAEQGYSILEEELEGSRLRWEEEKTGFILKMDEQEAISSNASHAVEEYKQQVVSIENQYQDLYDKLQQKIAEVMHLEELAQQRDALLNEQEKKSIELYEEYRSLEEDLTNKDSIFRQIIHNSQPSVVDESYQRSTEDGSGHFDITNIRKHVKRLEDALKKRLSSADEDKLRLLQERMQATDARLQSQTNQLHQALADRDQLHTQLSSTTHALQQYQVQFNNLHAEYNKLKSGQQPEAAQTTNQPSDQVSQSEYQTLQNRLVEEVDEKNILSERLNQLENQLQEEIDNKNKIIEQWREEVHSLWRNQDNSSTSITIPSGNVNEEKAVLLKPSSFTRKVKRSRTLCSQWIRGKSQLRSHCRPFSLRALVTIYFVFLHIFAVKCAVGL